MHLIDIRPNLDTNSLIQRFSPPARYNQVSFDSYVPDKNFPSQAEGKTQLIQFAEVIKHKTSTSKSFNPADRKPKISKFLNSVIPFIATKSPNQTNIQPAIYLDGGYGVGKTHLLASLWHEIPGSKSYLTFTELTAYIGFAGMERAIEALSNQILICIDEFELDDVANTLMVVTLMRHLVPKGVHVAVTSNTLPDQLGQNRFSASEFKREISTIASYFQEIAIDGPDFRSTHETIPPRVHKKNGNKHITYDDFEPLLKHLSSLHPVHYGALFDEIDEVHISNLKTIHDQDQALLFVQFIDKLYDAHIMANIDGVNSRDLFDARFRNGSYRKKYGRTESRLDAMRFESSINT